MTSSGKQSPGMVWVECPLCEGSGELVYEVGESDFGAPRGGELIAKSGVCSLCDGDGEIEVEDDEEEMEIIVQLDNSGALH